MDRSNNDLVEKLLKLRVAVAYLGEREQCGWWSTRFLGSMGTKFLAFPYPRTVFAAGVTAASAAAKAFHDKRIGEGRVVHLFRLSPVMEQRLHGSLLSQGGQELLSVIENKEASFGVLADLGKSAITSPEGPICLGPGKLLFSGTAIPKLAGFYLDAFKRAKQTLPYFTAEEEI